MRKATFFFPEHILVSTVTLSDLQVEECRKLIRYKVRRFFGRRLSEHDIEDACSHTMTQVLVKLTKFDPGRGTLVYFMNRVVDSSLVDLARRRKAARRNESRVVQSLNTPLRNDDGELSELWQTLDGQTIGRHGTGWRSAVRMGDLRIDLRHAALQLTRQERALLHVKLAGYTVQEMATQFGVGRGTIHRRLKALRVRLQSLQTYT